jgi:hypothetical protein
MKRYIVFILACLLLLMPLVAYADLIVEPENDFYKRHQGQIIYLGRSFTANDNSGRCIYKKRAGFKKRYN